jgi:hypothetical protein
LKIGHAALPARGSDLTAASETLFSESISLAS